MKLKLYGKQAIATAHGQAESQKLVAQGKADSAVIEAEGNSKAVLIEAKAQAQANDLLSKSLTGQFIQMKRYTKNNIIQITKKCARQIGHPEVTIFFDITLSPPLKLIILP